MIGRIVIGEIRRATTRRQLADALDELRVLEPATLPAGQLAAAKRRAELGIVAIRFGLTDECARFKDGDGTWWRRRSLAIPEMSVDVRFALPEDGEHPGREAVIEAWNLWRLDGETT